MTSKESEIHSSSESRIAQLRELPAGAHIHIIGVCGTGMSAVLALLKELRFKTSGSDKSFYPPMGDVVRELADKLYTGYSEQNLNERPDFVVIGNSLSANNPEVEFALANKLPFASMPEVFSALLIGERDHCPCSIVITGTHGKTTTTAGTATLLDRAGLKPAYFIGGIPKDLPSGVRAVDLSIPTDMRTVVLEGDEYDSAFFARRPKFLSYRPDIVVITSLEFDHADIFNSLEEIEAQFLKLLALIPSDGTVLVCDDDPHLVELVNSWRQSQQFKAKLFFYGKSTSSKYKITKRIPGKDGQNLSFVLGNEKIEFSTTLSGEHNALNLLAMAAVAETIGLPASTIAKAISQFTGVLRRQHNLAEINGITIIEDFAHHPTAVTVTLAGLKESFPEKRLIAIFEPRSNTSRRSFFQESYAKSFDSADKTIILQVENASGYSRTGGEIIALDVPRLVAEINKRGHEATSFQTTTEIQNHLLQEAKSGDLLVLMSNGDFGGLIQSLPEAFKKQR